MSRFCFPSIWPTRLSLRRSSESKIEKITVAGITGAIGPTIIAALLQAGFKVQAFSHSSRKVEDLGVNVITVDYNNAEQLESLLHGQDAVISCLGDNQGAVAAQLALIHASHQAGVPRFLPSEFGCDTTNKRVMSFPFFKSKVEHQQLLKKMAAIDPDFSYTILITGIWLDWSLSSMPGIMNLGARSITVYDDGNTPFSITRVSTVAKAIVRILRKPSSSANRVFRIHETTTTQHEMIKLCESLDIPRKMVLNKTYLDSSKYEDKAWQAFYDPQSDPLEWLVPFVNLSIWSPEALCDLTPEDNGSLKVRRLRGKERKKVLEFELMAAMEIFSPQSLRSNDIGQDEKTESLALMAFEQNKLKLVQSV